MILTLVRRAQGRAGPREAAAARNVEAAPAAQSSSANDDELEELCRSLRIISARDMDGTVTTVFRSILIGGRDRAVGSSELAAASRLNRVTVIHHLQRLERLGVVEHARHKYRLRASGLSELVEMMRRDMMQSLSEAQELAGELDREFMLLRSREEDPSFDEASLPHTPLLQPGKKAKAGKNSR